MGQISSAPADPGIILSAVDRLVATNAAGGLPSSVSHLIAFGEDAAINQGGSISNIIALGENAASGNQISTVLVIGKDSGKMTGVAATLGGLIVLGSNSGNWTNIKLGTNSYAPILIGNACMPQFGVSQPASTNNSQIAIGSDIMASTTQSTSTNTNDPNILIGNRIGGTSVGAFGGFESNILIGQDIMRSRIVGALAPRFNIIIGHRSMTSSLSIIGSDSRNVLIGNDASITTCSDMVTVGDTITSGTVNAGQGVVLGAASFFYGARTIVIGNQARGSQGTSCIVIGERVDASAGTGNRSIVIGANITVTPAAGQLIVRTSDGRLIEGNFNTGNMHVGKSGGFNLDALGTTNAFQLTDGGATAGAPTAGGYLVSIAGALHWKGSAGTLTMIAPA